MPFAALILVYDECRKAVLRNVTFNRFKWED
jgi:hypothetical protein